MSEPRRGGRGGRWDEETKDRALAAYRDEGLAAAHHTTGVPKPTIKEWAKRAGIEPSAVNAAARERTQEATLTRLADLQAARADLVDRLQHVARSSLELQQRQVDAALAVTAEAEGFHGRLYTAEGERAPGIPDDLDKALDYLTAATAGPRLSEVVGVGTRAIHDLQLLEGKLPDAQGSVTVVFATPQIVASAPPPVRELEAVVVRDEDD